MASAKANAKKKSGGKVSAFFKKIGSAVSGFFKGIFSELKKVTWPTKKELFKSTVSVLAVCLVIGAIIFGIDSLLKVLLDLIRP